MSVPSGRLLIADSALWPIGGADPRPGPFGEAAVETFAAHRDRLGRRPRGTVDQIERLAEVGLTGCGGGHVPVAVKWRAAAEATGPLTVVANAAESEPLAGKDGTLLRQRPHLVLDGLTLAAEALGASRAVVWLHGDDDGARRAVERALGERTRWGAEGRAESGIEVVSGPSHYLAGEATAITRALEGGPPMPRQMRTFRPAPGAPATLVQNAETLARAALVARGLPAVQTAILTVVAGTDRRVVEVERGMSLGDAVAGAAPAALRLPGSVLLGGYGGTWARWSAAADLPVAEPAFRATGLTLGAGVVGLLAPGACGVATTAAIAAYLAAMSARQCGPCVYGLPAVAAGMSALAAGSARRRDMRRVASDLDAIRGRGACRHPDGTVRLVASALEVFADDVAAHLARRSCAGAGRSHLPVPASGTSSPRRASAVSR